MIKYLLPSILFLLLACKPKPKTIIPKWEKYDESSELEKSASHDLARMHYKLIQSKATDKNDLWKSIQPQIEYFTEADYSALTPLILEQDILAIQRQIEQGKLSYEKLTQWYLYRIAKFENDRDKTLHSIISINPNAVEEAKKRDRKKSGFNHPIFGMPILLKDNINAEGMPTTAGAIALKNNYTQDAHIVERIKSKGGIILGKANLSEWAYYFCQGCPLGYSAIGGQSLNPYGRMKFETGGSSAGSGTTMAVNYAAAAIGTETSGSILSPSSQNSIVGLKPTIGLLSRSGIVPISNTLDTPGPMTRNVLDNAILLSAMVGEDSGDEVTIGNSTSFDYWKGMDKLDYRNMRFGVFQGMLEDSIFKATIQKIKSLGAQVIELEPLEFSFDGFTTFLSADMQKDLPYYLENFAGDSVKVRSIEDVMDFNLQDTTVRSPYGQFHFEKTANENINELEFAKLKSDFKNSATDFFLTPMNDHKLDAILSINNWNAGHAAMAQFPCLTVPMGYKESGEPISLTFIAKPFEEAKLLQMGHAFEFQTKIRRLPERY